MKNTINSETGRGGGCRFKVIGDTFDSIQTYLVYNYVIVEVGGSRAL